MSSQCWFLVDGWASAKPSGIRGMNVGGSLGASLGHHRLFSHQSFAPPKWLHFLLAVFASMCMQGSPARWATDHVRHHLYPDRAGEQARL